MIYFSELAKKKIEHLTSTKKYAGIQVGVKTTGCSGLAYVLEYVKEYRDEPGVTNFAQDNFVVLVNEKDLVYLRGMTIDYVRQGLNEGFEFTNPNERDRCGCGESFRV
jgi:iron-sulfur cluster assembly protein